MTSTGIKPMNVGLIGCGFISTIYLENCTADERLNVLAVADLDTSRARAQAARFNIPRAETVEELLTTSSEAPDEEPDDTTSEFVDGPGPGEAGGEES